MLDDDRVSGRDELCAALACSSSSRILRAVSASNCFNCNSLRSWNSCFRSSLSNCKRANPTFSQASSRDDHALDNTLWQTWCRNPHTKQILTIQHFVQHHNFPRSCLLILYQVYLLERAWLGATLQAATSVSESRNA